MTPEPMSLERALKVAIEQLENSAEFFTDEDGCQHRRALGMRDHKAAAKLRAALPFLKAAEDLAVTIQVLDDRGGVIFDGESAESMLAAYREMNERER